MRLGEMFACLLLVGLLEGSVWAGRPLDRTLRTFGTLHKDEVIHRVIPRRQSPKPRDHFRRIAAEVVDRWFVLELSPHERLFSPNFQVISHNGSGTPKHHFINLYQFYIGRVHGEKKSHAWVHVDDENIVTATITLENETYHIEPSWRHFKELHPFHMITYKSSDILSNMTACGTNMDTHGDEGFLHMEHNDHVTSIQSDILRRRKRAVGDQACEIALVADHLFYKELGNNNVGATAQYLVNIAGEVDRRFRATDWGDGFNNLGLSIKKVIVHETSSGTDNPAAPYNVRKVSGWTHSDFLAEIGHSTEGWEDFCLVHVFTYQDFPGGLLGLAPIASPQRNKAGGICSFVLRERLNVLRHTNVGFSTAINHGNTLIVEQTRIVVQHEIGHNWGSPHDPSQCSGGSGGGYIMSAKAVDGKDTNNLLFSPCSKASILSVLRVKSYCFTEQQDSLCGNGYREEGEQCDGGLLTGGAADPDPCCTDTCTYRRSTNMCSDRNDVCCKNCRFATSETVCFRAFRLDVECRNDTFCTGTSSSCFPLESKPDGSTCGDNGQCMNGHCDPFCETQGMTSCSCSDPADECKICCSTGGNCTVFNKTKSMLHSDGTLCSTGYCDDGQCVNNVQDAISRFWEFITDLSVDSIAQWIRDNIVAAVLIISVILWVPCCLTFYYVDWYRKQETGKKEKSLKDKKLKDQEDRDATDFGRDDSRVPLLADEGTGADIGDIRPWYSLEDYREYHPSVYRVN